ncbi:hypothetical protein [Salininema proteolyticum]|uniref:Uncharacterized protein n=1 Tax=Salininema proteolyticum TaxID=1607685 RepID=A0ABV8TZZ0_9ACTN
MSSLFSFFAAAAITAGMTVAAAVSVFPVGGLLYMAKTPKEKRSWSGFAVQHAAVTGLMTAACLIYFTGALNVENGVFRAAAVLTLLLGVPAAMASCTALLVGKAGRGRPKGLPARRQPQRPRRTRDTGEAAGAFTPSNRVAAGTSRQPGPTRR